MNRWLLWLMLLLLLALAGVALAMLLLRRYDHRQDLLQSRLRSLKTYQYVQPLIERCRTLHVETITLRPEGITVTLFDPPGKSLRYVFEEHGLDEVAPEPLQGLAQAFALDLPELGKPRQYSFRSYREQTGDETVRWYEYMIQPKYKDSILRQRYDYMDP